MKRWDLSTDTAFKNFTEFISNMRLAGKHPVVELVPPKRSLDQNALAFALYQQIASQVEDQSISEIRAECKLVHGIPILRRDDPDFAGLYDKSIKHTLTYEEKLKAMEWFPVTRLFSKEQMSEYIDSVIRVYSQQGIAIIFPGEAA